MLRFRSFALAALAAFTMAAFACAKDASPSFLEADDLVATDGPFDRNPSVENRVALPDAHAVPEGFAAFLKRPP